MEEFENRALLQSATPIVQDNSFAGEPVQTVIEEKVGKKSKLDKISISELLSRKKKPSKSTSQNHYSDLRNLFQRSINLNQLEYKFKREIDPPEINANFNQKLVEFKRNK